MGRKKCKDIFAVYRDDVYLFEGTADEIVEKYPVARNYVLWSTYPSAIKRIENRRKGFRSRYIFVRTEKR